MPAAGKARFLDWSSNSVARIALGNTPHHDTPIGPSAIRDPQGRSQGGPRIAIASNRFRSQCRACDRNPRYVCPNNCCPS